MATVSRSDDIHYVEAGRLSVGTRETINNDTDATARVFLQGRLFGDLAPGESLTVTRYASEEEARRALLMANLVDALSLSAIEEERRRRNRR